MKPSPAFPSYLFITVLTLGTGIFLERKVALLLGNSSLLTLILDPLYLGIASLLFAVVAFLLMHKSEWATNIMLSLSVLLFGMTIMCFHDYKEAYSPSTEDTATTQFATMQRQRLATIYETQGLHGDEKAVVTAMTLGDKSEVSHPLRQDYSRSSASHVFALSGLHVGIIFAFLAYFLPRKRYPMTTSCIIVTVIWLYTMLVGCRPSIIRAAIMISIYTLIPLTGRRPTAISTVLTTALIVLIAKPVWLFDIGFQMSFSAVLSIVVFYQHLYNPALLTQKRTKYWKDAPGEPFYRNPNFSLKNTIIDASLAPLRWVYGISVVSMTAQVAVEPFIAYYFGTMCPWFLLTNCIVSPCVLIIIPTAIVTLFLGSLEPYLPFLDIPLSVCVFVLHNITHFLNSSISWIASLPGNISV